MISIYPVLIVDDLFTNRFLISEILETESIPFLTANNGKEALELLEEHQFSLILMDIEMPVMNGIETTAWVRSNTQNNNCLIPIIAITANTLIKDSFQLKGFTDLLLKPFTIDKILTLLNKYGVL